MAVVIRLQGLPVVAGSADIRHFFSGLNIPDGGVHIIGGEKAEAFIIFATDEDARQGMSYSGKYIKGSRVELFLSSKTEMQNIIEINRKRLDRGGRETVTGYRRSGSNNSGASGEGNLSHLVAAIKKGMDKPSYDSTDASQDKFHYGGSRNREISQEVYNQPMRESFKSNNVYLYIRGMPYSSTEEDVLNFFSGLKIDEVIILKIKGLNSGNGLVKFATSSDALKGLQRNREYMGSRFIEVRPSHEGAWIRNGGTVEKHVSSPLSTEQFAHNTESSSHREYPKKNPILSPERHSHSKSPARRVKTYSHSRSPSKQVMTHTSSRSWSPSGEILTHTHSRSPSRRITARTYSRSPPRRITARTYSRSPPRRVSSRSRSPPRRITARSRSRSPPKMIIVQTHSRSSPKRIITRSCSPFSGSTHSVSSSHGREYYVHVQNLPAAISKDELRVFLGEFTITDDQIIFLKPHSHKSRDAVVIFKSQRLYESVLKNHKQLLYNQKVYLFPVPKAKVPQLIGYSDTAKSPERHSKRRGNDEESHSVSYTCIYVRNFPFDVTHVEVQKFFAGFNIDDRDIHLLYDDKGAGLGEALVNFRSEDKAQKAASLNRRRFLGTEVLLRCISEEQMREFGTNATPEVNKKSHHSYEKGEHFYTVDSQGQSMRGNLKYSSYYKHSSDSVSSSDYFRDPPTDFGGRIPGTFSDGRFRVDSNFRGGSDHITLIQLKNMPLRVSHNEILDFFHGYSILPESLCIQKNKDGTSSEAVIALKNYDEAVSAINELNNRPIGQRKIKLTFT